MRSIIPPLDPLAHRAAIDAMEAQRAAYQRYARQVELQQHSLNDGDMHRAAAAVDQVTLDAGALDAGARTLAPIVARARESASDEGRDEIQRTLEALTRDAQKAEQAVRNLSSQLEAWRDATGRQLAELGTSPDGSTGDVKSPDTPDVGHRGYAASRARVPMPHMLDRRG